MIFVYLALAFVGAVGNLILIGSGTAVVVGAIIAPASWAALEWWSRRHD